MNLTVADKIEVVERLIMDRRFSQPGSEEYRTAIVLKSVAADIRARRPGVPGEAVRSLDRRIAAAKVARNGAPHYPADHLIGLGQEIIGRWPVVRQALERFEADLLEAAE